MKLIIFPLVILIAIAVVSQSMNATSMPSDTAIYHYDPVTGTYITNSSSSTGSTGSYNIPVIGILGVDGIIALIIALSAFGTIIGIHFLGSGLSDVSIMILYKSITFYAIWGIFSIYAFNSITSIPMLGTVFYLILTIFYSLGIVQQIGFSSGG